MPVPVAWLALVSLWPGDLYFAFPYSEALYALLMTASAAGTDTPAHSRVGAGERGTHREPGHRGC